MANLNPQGEFAALKARVKETLERQFPFEGRKHRLELLSVEVMDSDTPGSSLHIDNVKAQQDAKEGGRTWAVPVRASLRLVDVETGAEIDSARLTLLRLPKLTKRYSYIVEGHERQHDSVFRLRSRPYHFVAGSGKVLARWNLAKGLGFDININRATGAMKMRLSSSNIPMYSILKVLGVSDTRMERAWGPEVLRANMKGARQREDVLKAYKALKRPVKGEAPPTEADATAFVRKAFLTGTEVRPDAMLSAFGKEFTHVNGENLLLSTKKVLGISSGKEKPDDRQSLAAKDIFGTADFIVEALDKKAWEIKRRIQANLDRKTKVSDIISPYAYTKILSSVFRPSQRPDQTNPLQFVSGYLRTTIRGGDFGGVAGEQVNLDKDKRISPSHLGFLDVVQTPECWPPYAEVFTREGWRRWDSVGENTRFLCREGEHAFFAEAKRLHVSEYSGLLYCLDQGKIAYEVTPNHRMWVNTPWRPDEWRFVTADRVHGKDRRFDTGHGLVRGGELCSFSLPVVEGNNSSKNVTEPIDMTDWAEFMGWFLSEGSCYFREAGKASRYNVRIHQVKKAHPNEYARIGALLDRLPFDHHWDGEDKCLSITTKQLASYCSKFGKAHEKFIPDYLFDAHEDAREALLEALLLGDGRIGSVRKNGRSYKQLVYTTTSETLARDVERLAVSLGYPTRISSYEDKREERYLATFEVRLLQHRYRTARARHPNYPAKYETKPYSGKVYCATVEGGQLYCRMPGKVGFWSGNSEDTGIALHLPLGARKVGNDLHTSVYDRRKGEWVHDATPAILERSVVAFPDQVRWEKGKPVPLSDEVTVYDSDKRTAQKAWKDVDYVLSSPKAMLSFSANLIPFLQNNNGNRAMTAAKQQEQAVSLVHREAPLVQSKTDGKATFEQVLGGVNAHLAPIAGTVSRITKEEIVITGARGKKAAVSLYNHFSLNGGKNMIHAEPVVKVGDVVKKHQLVADTNFTKDGVLALGTNIRVAYLPFHGLNFEDGIVVSESAAKKLTSLHLHAESLRMFPGYVLDKKRWADYSLPEKASGARLSKLDDRGIIRPGETVEHGDVLVAALAPTEPDSAVARDLANIRRSLVKDYADRSLVWDHDHGGKVIRVSSSKDKITVYVRTEERLRTGDKLSGRHGNKGIVSRVISDHDMPKDKDGKPVHVLLNPAGVPSRMNVGQVLETAASKLGKKKGKAFVTENFRPGADYAQEVKDALKKEGLSDTEELFDAESGRSLGQVMVGDQYILKLHHMVAKKMTARSYGGAYSAHGAPPSGSGIPGGGQKFDQLLTYAMLAHGAKHNIREAATYKSDVDQDDVWVAIMTGRPLPDPRPSRAMHNFVQLLKAMGIHAEKKGDKYLLAPMTDKQTEAISNGALSAPSKTLWGRGERILEEKGGLFDPKLTGGLNEKGQYWSHIDLAIRIPNPIFETPIRSLLGVTKPEFEALVGPKSSKGFEEITERLSAIDVGAELKKSEAALPKLKGAPLDRMYRKTRYLQALQKLGVSPLEAYTNKKIPVLPPAVRPISLGPTGDLITDDLNTIYRSVGQINEQLHSTDPATPASKVQAMRAHLYDAVRALRISGLDLGEGAKTRHHRGLLEKVKGTSPKTSFFQGTVLSRRQDLSARSTIVPEPNMSLDEVGVPLPVAMEMYKPFVVRVLKQEYGYTPYKALRSIRKNESVAVDALHKVVAQRPVIMKRDPALHKASAMAFRPRIVSGKAIALHPLVTGGFNADFDGDAMALFVPVSEKAVDEAYGMLPSKNLFSPTHGGLMTVPGQDSLLGLYQATGWEVKKPAKKLTRKEAVLQVHSGALGPNEVVSVSGKDTTGGRLMLADSLPPAMRNDSALLYDATFRLDKRGLKKMLSRVARAHPEHFAKTVDKWKDHGNRLSYLHGSSFSLDDFHDGKTLREEILAPVKAEEKRIRSRRISKNRRDALIVDLYQKAGKEMKRRGEARYESSSNRIYEWAASGARGGWRQFVQLVMGPLLVNDPQNNPVPLPITKSFGEGLSFSEYWTSMHGARKGTLDRAQGTRDPGALTKEIVNTVINYQVTSDDCGTANGIAMSPTEADLVGRYLAKDVKPSGTGVLRAGTLVTGQIRTQLRNANVAKVVVRSPLRCEQSRGICATCFGLGERGKLHSVGTNIGVIAGQALGEPVTQLTMKTFHTGGTVGGSSDVVDAFSRVKQLFAVPKTLPGSAVVSEVDGTVTKVAPAGTGGWSVFVGRKEHHIPADRNKLPTVVLGAPIKKGAPLSSGPINPHDILRHSRNMNVVRNFLATELDQAYNSSGRLTDRRNIETVVRASTNLARVLDAPGHPEYLRGQKVPLSELEAANKAAKLEGRPQVKYEPLLRRMDRMPLDGREDWLQRLNFQRVQETLSEGAAQKWTSDIHGSTIAGIAHGAEFGFAPPKAKRRR